MSEPQKSNVALIESHLANWQTGWSLGAFGALAEFHQDENEASVDVSDMELTRATARGAIRFDAHMAERLTPVAYETLSPKPHRWNHGLAFCLAANDAGMNRRSVLTELGPDHESILPANRDAILFDMGLSLQQCDFCVRTSDLNLISVLRANAGRSLFERDNPAMAAILKTHPHRVAITKAGRAEVFQKIGGPDTGGVSPAGPHTHVLPKLLASGRTHTANTPIPDNMVPVAFMHPGNPVIDGLGEDRPFDLSLHSDFQEMLAAHGRPALLAAKLAVSKALASGTEPVAYAVPNSRHERAALRVALRQQKRLAELDGDEAGIERIVSWRKTFDAQHGIDADEEMPGHDD